KSLQRFGPGDGLSHLQIRGLAIDQAQHLWVMTLSGLCKRVGTQFVCYDYDSGLTNELYIARSISCSASGYLYAGGDNGVDLFHPDSIRSPHISGLFLDEMLLFNKPITVGQPSESGFTLPYSLNELELLELSHQERMVSFSFSGLGYKNQDQYRYAYQLEGFDPGWQEVPASRRIATYTNLPPGDYTFKVRAAAANGTWTEAKALAVVVHPPWWASWWARSLFWLMVGGIIYGLFSLRIRALRRELHVQQRINSAKEEERERVRAESAQDFHDQAGVQLSKLSLYSGVLRSWDTPDQPTDILDKMDANIRLLASSMKDFIWTLDQRQDQLLDLMVRINDVGKSLFDHSEIRFDFDFTIEQIEDMPVSTSIKRHLLLFCKEALNNSLKYSEAQHVQMKVQWLEVGKQLRLRLQDDGIGFQLGTLRRVNGLHIMEKRAKAMEGALTVDSVPGVGTLIQLDLPITPDGV
ncbi:MAG: triple tyrosine motif-containing protein, partial [Bacteroidota bacterium]